MRYDTTISAMSDRKRMYFVHGPLAFALLANLYATSTALAAPPTTQEDERLAKVLGFELLMGFVLFMVFLIGSLLMVRAMRRLRKIYLRPHTTPTQSDDVWKMHKLPKDALKEDPFEDYN